MSVDSNYDAIMARGGDKLTNIVGVQIRAIFAKPTTVEAAYARLLELVERASKIIQPSTPCKKGCSYCCYMAVGISEQEAEIIAKHTGRPMRSGLTLKAFVNEQNIRTFSEYQERVVSRHRGVRCTFLGDEGECTIYEVRPLACRTNFNLSDTPDVCNLELGPQDVPNINLTPFWMAHGMIHGGDNPEDARFGDIRDYFG